MYYKKIPSLLFAQIPFAILTEKILDLCNRARILDALPFLSLEIWASEMRNTNAVKTEGGRVGGLCLKAMAKIFYDDATSALSKSWLQLV